jgi:putative tricarboxylic transport membrane protein
MDENQAMVFSIFAVLAVANILMLPSCYITTKMFGLLLRIPEALLMGFITVLCILGSYGSRGNLFDIVVTVVAGVSAYFLRRLGFPAPPLVIGFVLGQQFEMSIGQMDMFRGDMTWIEYIFSSPIALVLFAIVALLLIMPQVSAYRSRKAARTA